MSKILFSIENNEEFRLILGSQGKINPYLRLAVPSQVTIFAVQALDLLILFSLQLSKDREKYILASTQPLKQANLAVLVSYFWLFRNCWDKPLLHVL